MKMHGEAYYSAEREQSPGTPAMVPLTLFLDFDGVLHPDAVYRRRGHGVFLHKASLPPEYHGSELFGYAGHLMDVLNDFPTVRIVLSSSWVASLCFTTALSRLPPALQKRVVGATYHSRHTPDWDLQTRYQQIMVHVERHHLGQAWIAIDNDSEGWPDAKWDRLVLTDDLRGISDPKAQAELRSKLTATAMARAP
jgi:hypothetical protein